MMIYFSIWHCVYAAQINELLSAKNTFAFLPGSYLKSALNSLT